MLDAHHFVAYLVLGAGLLAAVLGFVTAWRRRKAGHILTQVVAAAQTLVVAQVGMGLVLLSQGRRVEDQLHYLYGSLSLAAMLAPWMYAPQDPRRRIIWFAGSALVAAALAGRAYMSAVA